LFLFVDIRVFLTSLWEWRGEQVAGAPTRFGSRGQLGIWVRGDALASRSLVRRGLRPSRSFHSHQLWVVACKSGDPSRESGVIWDGWLPASPPPRLERARCLGGHGLISIWAETRPQDARVGRLPEVRERDAFHGYITSNRWWNRSSGTCSSCRCGP